jgi:hypothetical protein
MSDPSQEISKGVVVEALGLLDLPQDDLYAALGAQTSPGKAARLTQTAQRTATLAETAVRDVRAISRYRQEVEEGAKSVGQATSELAQSGKNFFQEFEAQLRKAVCTEDGVCKDDIAKLLEDAEGLLTKLIPLIITTLNLPTILTSIAITIAVILMKTGLQTWCAMGKEM